MIWKKEIGHWNFFDVVNLEGWSYQKIGLPISVCDEQIGKCTCKFAIRPLLHLRWSSGTGKTKTQVTRISRSLFFF